MTLLCTHGIWERPSAAPYTVPLGDGQTWTPKFVMLAGANGNVSVPAAEGTCIARNSAMPGTNAYTASTASPYLYTTVLHSFAPGQFTVTSADSSGWGGSPGTELLWLALGGDSCHVGSYVGDGNPTQGVVVPGIGVTPWGALIQDTEGNFYCCLAVSNQAMNLGTGSWEVNTPWAGSGTGFTVTSPLNVSARNYYYTVIEPSPNVGWLDYVGDGAGSPSYNEATDASRCPFTPTFGFLQLLGNDGFFSRRRGAVGVGGGNSWQLRAGLGSSVNGRHPANTAIVDLVPNGLRVASYGGLGDPTNFATRNYRAFLFRQLLEPDSPMLVNF